MEKRFFFFFKTKKCQKHWQKIVFIFCFFCSFGVFQLFTKQIFTKMGTNGGFKSASPSSVTVLAQHSKTKQISVWAVKKQQSIFGKNKKRDEYRVISVNPIKENDTF